MKMLQGAMHNVNKADFESKSITEMTIGFGSLKVTSDPDKTSISGMMRTNY